MLILLWSQDQYQPRIPRLGASSMHCARIALDVVQRSQYVQDLCDLSSLGSTGKKNTVCLLLKFWPPSTNPLSDNWMKIECAPNMVNVIEYSSPNHLHCPVTLDQWDCFQNVLEEHGGRELFPNHQSNTGIFFSNLLLQPNKLSNDHQTNAVFVNDDFEDRIFLSCKIQLLHRLPSGTFDCVEEDWPLSSKDRTRQDFVLMAQCQSIFFHVLVWLLLYQRVLSVVVLLLPLIWLQPPWCLFVALALLVDLQEFLRCLE